MLWPIPYRSYIGGFCVSVMEEECVRDECEYLSVLGVSTCVSLCIKLFMFHLLRPQFRFITKFLLQ